MKADQNDNNTPLFVAIAAGLFCLAALKPAFYGMASEAWHYYLSMYVSEMIITGAIIKCCSTERYFRGAISLYILSMTGYMTGLVVTLMYTREYIKKHSASMVIDSLNMAGELFFMALVVVVFFDINHKLNRIN